MIVLYILKNGTTESQNKNTSLTHLNRSHKRRNNDIEFLHYFKQRAWSEIPNNTRKCDNSYWTAY